MRIERLAAGILLTMALLLVCIEVFAQECGPPPPLPPPVEIEPDEVVVDNGPAPPAVFPVTYQGASLVCSDRQDGSPLPLNCLDGNIALLCTSVDQLPAMTCLIDTMGQGIVDEWTRRFGD